MNHFTPKRKLNALAKFSWSKLSCCVTFACVCMFRVFHLNAVPFELNTGQSVPIPRHSQTRVKNAGLVTLET